MRERRGDAPAFLAAHPDRHHEGLDPDIGETQRLQPLHRPFPRARLGFSPGRARADFGGEPLNNFPSDGVGGGRKGK